MTLFKSFCNKPVVAAKNAVKAPTQVIKIKGVDPYSKIGDDLNNK